MKIKIKWFDHDPRKFGRPWILRIISWKELPKRIFEWGESFYNISDGTAICIIEASHNDVLIWGRRDLRRHCVYWERKTGIVLYDGRIRKVSRMEAWEHWNRRQHEKDIDQRYS